MEALIVATLAAGALAASSAVASAVGSPGDQDAVRYATEMNAASRADGPPDDTTPYQARNNGAVVCHMRHGDIRGPKHLAPFTGRELIAQFGGNHSAFVMVTRAEYHFCPQYL